MRRRSFVASASALAFGFGGCLGQGDPVPSNGDQDDQPSVQGHSIETVETGCLSGDETGVDASFGEGTVTVDGAAETPTPCYEAVVGSAAVDAGELRLKLEFERDDSEACVDCVGAVTYAATVDLDTTDGIDTVIVTHGQDGAQFTAQRGGAGTTPSPTDDSGTPMDDPGSNPDPDLQVLLDNEHDEAHEIRVEIRRESGETVYDKTHEIKADSERDIYNLREASPDGVEAFTIAATMDGETESMQVETSTCYGSAIVSVTDDGELYPYYSIC